MVLLLLRQQKLDEFPMLEELHAMAMETAANTDLSQQMQMKGDVQIVSSSIL
jgi:hypothetical protein